MLKNEATFKYMLLAAFGVFVLIIIFDLTRTESILLALMVFSVLALETINTLFERMLDIVRPQHDERVRIIKDLMAALVLIASAGAAVLGLIILWPYFRTLF